MAGILIFSGLKTFSVPSDSSINKLPLKETFYFLRSSVSSSYIIQKNFNQNDYRNFLFLSNTDYYYKVTREKFIQSYHCKANLGYIKYLDSIWFKYSDGWKINVLFHENESKTITHSYALDISSQFLNTYRYNWDTPDQFSKQWRGGFLNPGTINFSYNMSLDVWDNSNIMLGLSSIRVATKPRYQGAVEPIEPIAKTSHAYILATYGMSGQVNIYSQKIAENITCDNNSGFFVNGINKNQMNFDFQNTFTYKFLKYLELRFDTHVLYDPLTSCRLQYDQEFLIGVFIEKRK